MHAVFNYFMLSYIFFHFNTHSPPGAGRGKHYLLLFVSVKLHYSSSALLKGDSNTDCVLSHCSPAAREKDLLPPPSLEHQNPPRPRSKPPSGKTAPRKEPRSATNSNNNTVTPPAALQQTPVPIPAVSVNQVRCWGMGYTCVFVGDVESFFVFLLPVFSLINGCSQ